jgi:hypothetical protein
MCVFSGMHRENRLALCRSRQAHTHIDTHAHICMYVFRVYLAKHTHTYTHTDVFFQVCTEKIDLAYADHAYSGSIIEGSNTLDYGRLDSTSAWCGEPDVGESAAWASLDAGVCVYVYIYTSRCHMRGCIVCMCVCMWVYVHACLVW